MAGVPALGWPQWLADSLGLSYTRYGLGGATSSVIVDKLLPRVRTRYAVGVLNMGTNDALGKWDATVFEQNFGLAAETLVSHCDKVLALTVPVSAEATEIIRRVAADLGVLVIDAEVRGPRLLKPDGVHPTALGHLAIADRAAEALGAQLPSGSAVQQGQGRLGAGYHLGYAVGSSRSAMRKVAKLALRR
ncbi:SGNH/GDSL hydrolase family protein [Paenarthrobacter sp. JL.01a]|uniref:SGNH/GDSL hydrolase family protein n=1 Tax=Paenarthrobacter sp. JL.01a TaxID=2979324 RepID=UPI003965D42B